MKRPYYLKKRGDFWYYRLNAESGLVVGENKNYVTTGCRSRAAAEAFMADMLGEEPASPTFGQYAEPFFVWGECPHIRRVLEEAGRFTQRHARIQRGRLENHVFDDPFPMKRLSEITRADIFDLRSRLMKKCTPATTNKVIDVVKAVIREAVIREEFGHGPTEFVRRVRHQKRERGIFSVDELKRLFPEHGYEPWEGVRDYTCFYLAAVSGARRGELLVLRWRHIDFEGRCLNISEAWKGRDEIGGTKSVSALRTASGAFKDGPL